MSISVINEEDESLSISEKDFTDDGTYRFQFDVEKVITNSHKPRTTLTKYLQMIRNILVNHSSTASI